MTNKDHERIIDVGGNSMKISVEGVHGDTDQEFLRMSAAVSDNIIQVTNNLSETGGDVSRLAIHAMELVENKELLVWVGRFENITEHITAAYIYPDADSVITAIIANVGSKELIKDWKIWDQATFMTVATAIFGSVQAFENINSEAPRRALNMEEFNIAYQQNPESLRIMPLETRISPK